MWYNISSEIKKEGDIVVNKFVVDIENIKNDLEIEGMSLSQSDVDLLQSYSNKQINQEELINKIKENINEEIY